MNHKDHHEGSLVNIVSGKLATGTANVENAVVIGEAMLKDFENTWPEGFFSTISKKQGSVENSNSIGLQSYQKVILSSIENKKQVIPLIFDELARQAFRSGEYTKAQVGCDRRGSLPYWSQHERKEKLVWSGDQTWRGQHHHYPPSPALCWTGPPNRCDVGWYRRRMSSQEKGNTWH